MILISLYKIGKSFILNTICRTAFSLINVKDDYAFTIPLSMALQSPDEMIDQMINNKGNKDFKSLFKICELDLDKLFNQQIVKFELLTQIFMQMKDQITQNLQELKEIQEQLRKLKESFFEKCHCNLLNQLIDQLKELDKQTKSDQYKQIIEKLNNSMIEEMLKDNCSLITNNTNEILQCHQDISDIPDNLSHDGLNFMQSQNLHQNTQFIYRFQPKCYNNIYQYNFKLIYLQFQKRKRLSIQNWYKDCF